MIRRISKIIRNVTELVLYSVTVIAAAALICAYLASAVDPASNTFFIPFGLAAPFIIGLNLLLALFWIIRWKPIAFLPVLLLAIGYGVVSRHIQLPVLKQYEKRTSADIDVTTYNVHIFRDADWNGSIDSIAKYIKTTDPDILAIQEYYASSSMPADTIGTIMGGYPYFKTFYIRSEPGSGVGYGLALYSRHKILRSEEIVFENESNGAMYADMIIEGDTVRVFNCHMQTTDVNNNDIALVEGVENESQIEMKAGLKRIMGKLRNNGIKRAAQADIVAGYVQSSPYPVILCGDFNDVPASYTYKKLSQGLKDGFKAAGRGYAHSFRELHSLFNVDYVFYTPTSFECIRYNSPSLPFSDHNPVTVRLRKAK
ncbi:MAG: endonuclease/exonuclease/phosphatase family protein [Rikenellaceae bacterium]|nr:endonuclease/exonuclease/phosphatase family protein [Rikenellaceae bacterium]